MTCPCGREEVEYPDCTSPFCYQTLVPDTQAVKIDGEVVKAGHRLVLKPAPDRNLGPGLSYRRCAQAETIDAIIAEKPVAQTVDQLRELVVTALTKIHDRRYGHRHTVSAFNAMEMFTKANREKIEMYDDIKALIKALKNE